ncbi:MULTISPECIES: DoxX family protein [Emticicia]|uniref:DoxX family protein n=1 Tax=Emticicia TaxID=312278 RepID=UPI0007D89A7D|nr:MULTISPECIES: DoxX family protein [Emticicia]
MEKTQKNSKTLNLILWGVQSLIAITMLWASGMKLLQPTEKLAQMWPWVANHAVLVKFTGIVDLLGGIGIILPTILRIRPKVTVITALAIVVLMLCATIFHILRSEAPQIGVNIVFGFMAGFVAWGRTH